MNDRNETQMIDRELEVVFTATLAGTLDQIASALEYIADQLRQGYRSGDEWDTNDPEQR